MAENRTESSSLVSNIVKDLTTKIVSGELEPGDKLPPEREFAETMGVSRSSLHQAIVTLENQGLLTIAPRDGTYVNDIRKNPTAHSLNVLMNYSSIELEYELFEDMMDTRIWLEKECVKRACTKIDAKGVVGLQVLLSNLDRKNVNLGKVIYEFHYAIVKMADNSVISMFYSSFEEIIQAFINRHYTVAPQDLTLTKDNARELIKALEENNPEKAQMIVEQLIVRGVTVLRKKYE